MEDIAVLHAMRLCLILPRRPSLRAAAPRDDSVPLRCFGEASDPLIRLKMQDFFYDLTLHLNN